MINLMPIPILDGGQIVEEGAPDELLSREDGRFRRMYEVQMGGGDGFLDGPDAADDDDAGDDGAGGGVAA